MQWDEYRENGDQNIKVSRILSVGLSMDRLEDFFEAAGKNLKSEKVIKAIKQIRDGQDIVLANLFMEPFDVLLMKRTGGQGAFWNQF